ncbi:MAG: carboxymuconolactone decarboxylase family protein [Acidaminococcaceae bacterium]
MKKTMILLLVGIIFTMVGLSNISEAKSVISGKQGLNSRQEAIAAIAAFTAKGDLDHLKIALNEGLDAGLTVNEIKEVLVQMYAYTGFPRSLNGISTFMGVMDERKAKGIEDIVGKEASPISDDKTSLELGTEIQTTLAGGPVKGPLFTFAPAIDQFLKGHLFGDIFGRDVLDFQSREIATISALASMNGVNSQMQAHFNIGFNTGLTESHMNGLVDVLADKVGKKEADNASEILGKVLVNRTK